MVPQDAGPLVGSAWRSAPVCRMMVGLEFLSSGHHPASRHATIAQLAPVPVPKLLSSIFYMDARCVPKRITYTAGAFSIV